MEYNVVEISEEMGFVQASRYRIEILQFLNDGQIRTPKELGNELDMLSANLSRATTELEEKGLVECLNPQARKGKMKRITDKGERVLAALEREDMLS